LKQDSAETIALQALGWLVGQDDLLGAFLSAGGLSLDDLRLNAQDPEFLAATLDFILQDDSWVIGAAEAAGIAPEALAQARAALPGGATLHWT
jgi:hypothetical protein